MRNPKNALSAAIDNGDVPARKSLFDNAQFRQAYPMYPTLLEELNVAVPRPKTPLYQNISTIVSTTLSPPNSISPQATANELRASISDALAGKGILP
jgi:multiple sugar transport system substrate-binding protein